MRGPTKHSRIGELRATAMRSAHKTLIGLPLFVLLATAPLPFSAAAASQAVQCPSSQCLECAQSDAVDTEPGMFVIKCIRCRPIKNCSPPVTKSEGQSATTTNQAVQAFGKKRPKLIRVKPSGGS